VGRQQKSLWDAGKSAANLVDRAVGMTIAEIAKIAGQWL
jgi:hypothetical protein